MCVSFPGHDDNAARKFLKAIAPDEARAEERRLTPAARRAFPGDLAARWLGACRKLAQAGYGDAVVTAYVRQSPAIAEILSPDISIDLADWISALTIKAKRKAGERLPWAMLKAAERLRNEQLFWSWLGVIERFAALAPESVAPVLEKMDGLLTELNVSRFEAWVLAGVRSAGGDAERRLRFFTFADPQAKRWLRREAGAVDFTDMERRLKAYLIALWRLRVPIREPSPDASEQSRRRVGFDRGLILLPPTFPGYRGRQAEDIFRASLAHVAAHFMYSKANFALRRLKPLQVAIISLIEDARVEHLAMREFPGLRRLWLPFHIARSSGSSAAPILLARLSRALIDPGFEDASGWVRKGRDRFFSCEDAWENPQISREIGGLLGNDLGQMRVQFNPRTYVVEPPYRDDNMGLWDFDDPDSSDIETVELLFESVRFERRDDDDASPPDREREKEGEDDEANRAAMSREAYQDEGIPVARYPEYDYVTGRERADWTTIVEFQPKPGPAGLIERILEDQHDIVNRITSLIGSARVGRTERLKRRTEGEYLDIDACIDAVVSRRIGVTPDPHIYATMARRHRDLSVLVLLDISESSKDRVRGATATVLDLERQATALLAHAMAGLGDPFAMAAFCSNRREEVRYYRIKDFDAPYDALARSSLAGLEGGLSTRIGAAIRHAGADLAGQGTHRRLLLIVTDGEPSDIDVTDPKYLVEDARKAVLTLAGEGIDTFCVGLDSGGDSYLSRIFGRRNFVQIDRLERLPERLPMLFFRLTS
ncbi:VWA domain-containing protein [bacterium AH-315-B06]|nr:VWA domain-containing protein [bacterium AH-315-B06]